jgi:hypothetical protein
MCESVHISHLSIYTAAVVVVVAVLVGESGGIGGGGGGSSRFARACALALCRFALVGLEGDLQHPVAEGVAVERLDCDDGLVVVGHGDEAEALALVGLQVADHLDALHGAERAEQLPQHVLLGLGRQVVDKDAPTGAVHRVAWEHAVGQKVASQGRVSAIRHTMSFKTTRRVPTLKGFGHTQRETINRKRKCTLF